jgi:hypothetical protein
VRILLAIPAAVVRPLALCPALAIVSAAIACPDGHPEGYHASGMPHCKTLQQHDQFAFIRP